MIHVDVYGWNGVYFNIIGEYVSRNQLRTPTYLISTYKDNPSIKSIKEQLKGTGFSMSTATEENMYEILVSLNPKGASSKDLILSKVVFLSVEILSYLE